eukprot:5263158-Prorocentrum_lima.AAC.1
MAGEQLVVRFHSDAGSEFWNKDVSDLLNKNLIMQTMTAGYYPEANVRAKRYVGILKRKATSYLIHACMSLKFWHWAACQSAYM